MENISPTEDPFFKKLFEGKETSYIIRLIHLMKELPALEAVLGAHYEIKDSEGNIVYTITKRELDFEQVNILLEEVEEYAKIQEKKGKKGKGLNKSKPR